MKEILQGYTIAIPAYGRPKEFIELLDSILSMEMTPQEVLVCEDFSKERSKLSKIAEEYKLKFSTQNIEFVYVENEKNLGYDANVRKLIQFAKYKWVILIGNDDLFLPNGLKEIDDFCKRYPEIAMISRPFIRFEKKIDEPLGLSRILKDETVINKSHGDPKLIFRVCGFVGGLVVNKEWADVYHTSKYDGTLYYQIYLAANAYCTDGIGYLKNATVGGRAGNPPLFGESGASNHIPGSYSAKGRASMWKGVLDIGKDIGKTYGINLYNPLREELMIRQSFHIFEMNASASKKKLKELKSELQKLDLFNHWLPKSLYLLNYTFSKNSQIFYSLTRKILQ